MVLRSNFMMQLHGCDERNAVYAAALLADVEEDDFVLDIIAGSV